MIYIYNYIYVVVGLKKSWFWARRALEWFFVSMVRWFPGSEGRKAWGFMMVVGRVKSQNLPSLKLTTKAPENRPGPKRKFNRVIPTIHFQVRTVSFREGRWWFLISQLWTLLFSILTQIGKWSTLTIIFLLVSWNDQLVIHDNDATLNL